MVHHSIISDKSPPRHCTVPPPLPQLPTTIVGHRTIGTTITTHRPRAAVHYIMVKLELMSIFFLLFGFWLLRPPTSTNVVTVKCLSVSSFGLLYLWATIDVYLAFLQYWNDLIRKKIKYFLRYVKNIFYKHWFVALLSRLFAEQTVSDRLF